MFESISILLLFLRSPSMTENIRSNWSKRGLTEPLPEHHILLHRGALDLALLRQVEDLQCLAPGFERDDLSGPVHDRTVGLDRPSDDLIAILELDDYDLRLRILIRLLAHTYVVIRL